MPYWLPHCNLYQQANEINNSKVNEMIQMSKPITRESNNNNNKT